MPDVLVIGYSSIAKRRVIPALDSLGEVGRIDIATMHSASHVGTIGKIGKVFGSYEQALDRTGAAIVYVSTVNADHLAWALAALESGRHVIVDKPACTSAADTEALVREAERCGRLVAEATVYSAHPLFDILRRHVDLDHATRATAVFSVPPLSADNFRYQSDLGGGAINDLGPYAVSIGRVLFGAAPSSVFAVALTHSPTGVETAFSILAEYGAGRSLVGHFGFDTAYINRLELVDSERCVEVERVFTSPGDFENEVRMVSGQQVSTVPVPAGDAFAAFLGRFVRDVEQGSGEHYHSDMLADAGALQRVRDSVADATPTGGTETT